MVVGYHVSMIIRKCGHFCSLYICMCYSLLGDGLLHRFDIGFSFPIIEFCFLCKTLLSLSNNNICVWMFVCVYPNFERKKKKNQKEKTVGLVFDFLNSVPLDFDNKELS